MTAGDPMTRSDAVLVEQARVVLRANDRGDHTEPTASGLYPAQWNWDSALVATGFATFDIDRAWTEIRTLLSGQWADGMVPSILFHGDDSSYFPNSRVWRAGAAVASSGITQPPILATSVRRLVERTPHDRREQLLAEVLPGIRASHEWLLRARDPEGTGLVAIVHPWESGMDNSPVWDAALAAVPPEPPVAHLRRDTGFAAADDRPRGPDYDRFLNLVTGFREVGYDPAAMWAHSPFLVADVGFNALFLRAQRDLLWLLDEVASPDPAGRARVAAQIERQRRALAQRWSPTLRRYCSYDVRHHREITAPGVGGLLPLYAEPALAAEHPELLETLRTWRAAVTYGVPSFDPRDPAFERRRYWRGPVWLVVNRMLADGLRAGGHPEPADVIDRDSLSLLRRSGFAEYFDPVDGSPLGGRDFSWTAAMALVLLS